MKQKPRPPRQQAEALIRLLVPDWQPTPRQVLWAIRIAIVLSLLVAIGYSYGITLWDWIKLLIIPGVIAAGGLWFNQQQQERQREFTRQQAAREKKRDEDRRNKENRDEFRKKLLERLNRAYADTKRIRRLLRATAFSPPYYEVNHKVNPEAMVLSEPYDEHLQALNDTQLDLEVLAKDVKASGSVFTHVKEVADAVGGMADCLNAVIKEYEVQRGRFSGSEPSRSIRELKDLSDFVRSRGASTNFKAFVKHYEKATVNIQKDIL